jgi:hypothetical protein
MRTLLLLPLAFGLQGNPVHGYDDTPMLPDGMWRVHDSRRPPPPVVTPGNSPSEFAAPPSDAIVLFRESEIVPGKGDLESKESFGDCQLHLEFQLPPPEGDGQHRGNSGVFLMGRYEIQILDSFENRTYADGQCAALYGQHPPLVNACRKPGEWQSYDVIFRAPRFEKGELAAPATATVIHNGVLVHDRAVILGDTAHRAVAKYSPNDGTGPLRLQDHGSRVRFRNVWIRELGG